jgi:hypothetical protein
VLCERFQLVVEGANAGRIGHRTRQDGDELALLLGRFVAEEHDQRSEVFDRQPLERLLRGSRLVFLAYSRHAALAFRFARPACSVAAVPRKWVAIRAGPARGSARAIANVPSAPSRTGGARPAATALHLSPERVQRLRKMIARCQAGRRAAVRELNDRG